MGGKQGSELPPPSRGFQLFLPLRSHTHYSAMLRTFSSFSPFLLLLKSRYPPGVFLPLPVYLQPSFLPDFRPIPPQWPLTTDNFPCVCYMSFVYLQLDQSGIGISPESYHKNTSYNRKVGNTNQKLKRSAGLRFFFPCCTCDYLDAGSYDATTGTWKIIGTSKRNNSYRLLL